MYMAKRSVLVIAVALLVSTGAASGETMGTAFTYQGQLKQDGQPVNGACDFEFTLWNAQTGESQVGPTLTFDGLGGNPPPISVVNGLLTAELDFGADVFGGDARWLRIRVRCPTGVGVYTTLDPRQPLTATPYALHTRGLSVDDTGLDVEGDMHASGKVAANAFAGNSPLIFEAPLGVERMRIDDVTGNVGIGTTNPLGGEDHQSLHVSNIDLSLSSGPLQSDDILIESNDAVLGLYSAPQGSAGSAITFKEIDAGALVDTWAILRETTNGGAGLRFTYGSDNNYFANPTLMYLGADGNVGIGTNSSAQAALHVGGTPGVDGIMFPDGSLQRTAAAIGEDSISWREIKDTRRLVVAKEPPFGDGGGDYSTIGDALDNMTCGLFNPCVILVMPGTYEENIRISNLPGEHGGGHIHIMGSGAEITTIEGQSALSPVIDLELTNNIIISGFTIDGSHSPTGIRMENAGNVTVMHNLIANARHNGVWVEGYTIARIVHNRISENGEVGNPSDAGIYDASGAIITNNELRDNAVGIWSFDSSPTVHGNELIGNQTGAVCVNSWGQIESNVIHGAGGNRAGILLTTGASPLIKDNRIRWNSVGIEFGDDSSPQIIENVITGNNDGIFLVGGTGSPSVLRNVIRGNPGHGIRIESSSAVLAIHGNTIVQNTGDGVFLDGYSNTVSPLDEGGALISHNAIYGNSSGVDVRVSNCALGSHVVISHNIVNTFSVSIVCVDGGLNSRVNGAIFPPF
jgi:parallel beta-helix repeat protein